MAVCNERTINAYNLKKTYGETVLKVKEFVLKYKISIICACCAFLCAAGIIAACVIGGVDKIAPDRKTQEHLIGDVSSSAVKIDKYFIYGTHLHLEGTLSLEGFPDWERMGLVLRDADGTEKEIYLITEKRTDTVKFKSSQEINTGLCLDEIPCGDYCILFKVVCGGKTQYVSCENLTEYSFTDYYTVTNAGKNNRILIGFEDYYNSEKYIPCLAMKVETARLPENVYDVVIDAGHGTSDPGAVALGYNEADITIDYALSIKEALEAKGLKVYLSRNGSETGDEMGSYAAYSKNGRINGACASRAKFCLSVHLNSTASENPTGGVEIYCPSNSDLAFAKNLADSLVKNVGIPYSQHGYNRVENGVYVRTFTQDDIADSAQYAEEGGYEKYPNLSTDTTYYYIIRELGGIATGAYVDGRNPEYGTNLYYNANYGMESYLAEIGYICVEEDLNLILNAKQSYVNTIADCIANELSVG